MAASEFNRSPSSIEIKPHAYDPVANPEFFVWSPFASIS
jgi:hypothetical protein